MVMASDLLMAKNESLPLTKVNRLLVKKFSQPFYLCTVSIVKSGV